MKEREGRKEGTRDRQTDGSGKREEEVLVVKEMAKKKKIEREEGGEKKEKGSEMAKEMGEED